jgi:uncharacterized protein (TIGR03086 family)
MNTGSTATVVTGGVALLERAMAYTLGGLLIVTPEAMRNPTPCAAWDLRALLLHMNDSLLTLHEAIALGYVDIDINGASNGGGPRGPADPHADYGDPELDPVASLRNRACQLMGAWANAPGRGDISIGDRALTPGIVAAAGAVEVAVHGWDVFRACGQDRPVPGALAEELLDLCPLFVRDADRPTRFAHRMDLSSELDSPSDRLVAFLGRRPH